MINWKMRLEPSSQVIHLKDNGLRAIRTTFKVPARVSLKKHWVRLGRLPMDVSTESTPTGTIIRTLGGRPFRHHTGVSEERLWLYYEPPLGVVITRADWNAAATSDQPWDLGRYGNNWYLITCEIKSTLEYPRETFGFEWHRVIQEKHSAPIAQW